MVTEFRTVSPNDSLARAVDHVVAGFQNDFPVVDDGRVVGVLTRADLLAALPQRGPDAKVRDVMQCRFETADPSEMVGDVFARLQDDGCRSLPVVRGGRLVGIVTMENVGELMALQEALRPRPLPTPSGATRFAGVG